MSKLAATLFLTALTAADFRAAYGDDDQFTYGALACVAQLQRANPSQPKDIPNNKLSVLARSSGVFVEDSSRNVFLVTAAHNLVDCTDVQIVHSLFGSLSSPASI